MLPASGRPDPEVPAELFAPVLDRIRHAFDFVVVDTPHAETGAASATTEAASSVILVTNPTLQCAADAARAILEVAAAFAGRARAAAPKPPRGSGRAAFLRVLPRLVSG